MACHEKTGNTLSVKFPLPLFPLAASTETETVKLPGVWLPETVPDKTPLAASKDKPAGSVEFVPQTYGSVPPPAVKPKE